MMFRSALFAAFLALGFAAPALAEDFRIDTRPGVTVPVTLKPAENPVAVILYLEGGTGRLVSKDAFGPQAATAFQRAGLTLALMDTASDMRDLTPKTRMSKPHTVDIARTVKTLRQRTGLPVWVLGISAGSRSATVFAIRRSKMIGGVILASTITGGNRGKPVDQLPLAKISAPLLAIAHRNDGCHHTPPEGAAAIVAAAKNARAAEAVVISGGMSDGKDPCKPLTYHTFNGVEPVVVRHIAEFVKAHAR